jgi:asparagine synthase (glutamine-hydrolysing)
VCGIFGGLGVRTAPRGTWEGMARALAHRGPDGTALHAQGEAVLGLVRLAIVGTQEPAQVFRHGSIAAVMNGELYGHARLRRGLEVRGASDAAVVPALYARDGEAFVEALDGPFAIALFDGRRGCLHLVRDRLGKKPLYFAALGRAVFFASEQKALARLPGFRPEVDRAVAGRFLARGVLDDDELLFPQLDRVGPGEWVTVTREGRVTRRAWWRLADVARGRPVVPSVERLGAALRRAVETRLPTEVPAALLLSGGLDSTLVGAAAAPGVATAVCASSPGSGDVAPARRAAKALGLPLEVVPLPPPSIETFERALAALEQPDAFSTWAMAPAVLHLGRAVRDTGARVALMGEGADELFLGYAWDRLQAALERGSGAVPPDARRLLGAKARYFGLWHAQARLFSPTPRARQVWLDLASGVASTGADEPREPFPGVAGARRRQLVGLGLDMLTLPVLHADRLLMASGVEARMPFLDHHLVTLALRLPAVALEGARVDKPLLRELAARWVPGWRAPPKKGFSAAATPPVEVVQALRARLARGDSLAVDPAVWRRARGWRDGARVHALWRHVVLETAARLLVGAPLGGR